MVFLFMVDSWVKASLHNLWPRPFYILVVVGPGGKEGQNKTHTQRCPPPHTLFSIQHIVTFVTSNNQKNLDALSESAPHDLGRPSPWHPDPTQPTFDRKKLHFWGHQIVLQNGGCLAGSPTPTTTATDSLRTLFF